MSEQKMPNSEEIVDLIDRLMLEGNGHLNIAVDSNGDGIKIDTFCSSDCGIINGACCQPTEDAIDEDRD